jgi:euchromatic histone-lysine N-methyltransferase
MEVIPWMESVRSHFNFPVKLLKSLGANMETRNNSGHTPVLSALLLFPQRASNLATVQYLIQEAKCNVNAEGEDGRTALHHAARMGELQIVKMLVEAGAVVEKKNVGGFTALNAGWFFWY